MMAERKTRSYLTTFSVTKDVDQVLSLIVVFEANFYLLVSHIWGFLITSQRKPAELKPESTPHKNLKDQERWSSSAAEVGGTTDQMTEPV